MQPCIPKEANMEGAPKKRRSLLSRRTDLDPTSGPLFSSIIAYSIPLILSNLFSAFYHSADMAVLAAFAVGNEVASVGATSALTHLFLNTAIGLGIGANVILARCFGRKDREQAQTVISTSILTGAFLGVLLAIVGALLVPTFLGWTNCPADCIADATLYAVVYILGMPFYLVYNYAAAVIRVSGDSEHPLYYMIAGGLTNIVLNVLLCLVLPYKVLAVAIATLVSNALSAFLCLRRLAMVEGIAHWDVRRTRFDFATFRKMIGYGLPAALTTLLYPICNLQIQAGVNSFGAAAIAGNTASSQYESFVNNACSALSATALTFIGQNLGAKKPGRVYRSFFYAQAVETAIAVTMALSFLLLGRQLLPIFTGNDPAAIEAGLVRMRYVLLSYPIAMTLFGSTIQAFGYPQLQTAVNLIGVFGLRTVWMQFVYGKLLPATLSSLYLCFPVSIVFTHTVNAAVAIFLLLRYRKGKYKKNI
jgi:putative MATE family efflux protein